MIYREYYINSVRDFYDNEPDRTCVCQAPNLLHKVKHKKFNN